MMKIIIGAIIVADLYIGLMFISNRENLERGYRESEAAFISLHNTVKRWNEMKSGQHVFPSHTLSGGRK